MKVIIAGSRSITNTAVVAAAVRFYIENGLKITEVVSGKARGVDTIGEKIAEAMKVPVAEFPADWNKHGKAAGPIRNKQMADYADAAIIVWDGKSRGSQNMIDNMTKQGKPVHIYIP